MKNQLLVQRLNEVFLNGTWVTGTNYQNELNEMQWQQATETVFNLNSVAAITFHINYYLNGVLNVLNGGKLNIKDKHSFNAPPIETKQDWDNLFKSFINNAKAFIKAIEQLPEHTITQTFVDKKYGTYHRNIDVMIEHAYYHLGQIILIKNLLNQAKT